MSSVFPWIAVLVAAFGLWQAVRLAQAARHRQTAHARYFDEVKALFDGGETRLQPSGFPRMSGRKDGLTFDLQAIPDSLTFRKLPALWVMVTLPQPLPLDATLDLMARPSGQEPFSHFASMAHSLPPFSGLPSHVAVRCDNAARVPPASLISHHAQIFDDPSIKELVISPKGLRIVILAEEAARGSFLIFRDAEMGLAPLPAAQIKPVLDRLQTLRQDLIDWRKDAP